MARILLIDPSEIARRAMQGILARGEHRFAGVTTAQEAWDFLQRNVQVDLLFTELRLGGSESGLGLIQRLKSHPLLKLLPVVIYAEHGDRDSVKRALELRVQGFHVKPYHDGDIFAEIAKAESNPWRNGHFEEEKSFCKLTGYAPDQLHQMLADAAKAAENAVASIRAAIDGKRPGEIAGAITPVIEQAEAAGAWGLVESLNSLLECAQQRRWGAIPEALESLAIAGRLIAHRLDDTIVNEGFLGEAELAASTEARERRRWQNAPAEKRVPVVEREQVLRETDALPGVPAIDTSAAGFQMMANGHPSCLNPLMDVVDRDPGLAALVLIGANRAHPAPEGENIIEDARLAVSLLGEARLEALARQIPVAQSRFMNVPPVLDWARFWMFQRGVARIARYTCNYLEFYSMESQARMAGLLHDLGKLVLLRLHPVGFQVIVDHARLHQVTLAEAEQLYLGCTTREIGAHFAAARGLSGHYVNVIRWVDEPESAPADRVLVAIVSLARDLCRHNQVGASGDPPLAAQPPLEDTAEWRVLREHLFPSFDLRKFEQQVHAACGELRNEFSGHGRAGT